MAKIKGKFAPLFDELAEDQRWLLDCNDEQKLLFTLILFTIYTTNGTAPDDARYYIARYSLRRRIDRVTKDLTHIKSLFPKLICKDKKLSLLNAVVYVNRVDAIPSLEVEVEKEVELEVEIDRKKPRRRSRIKMPDDAFLKALKENAAYAGIDIDLELAKMDGWLLARPGRVKSQEFVVNWLNRAEKPLRDAGGAKLNLNPTQMQNLEALNDFVKRKGTPRPNDLRQGDGSSLVILPSA